ncbi:MAG TPA: M67 family metallopeptidase [Vicinamibacteria bacterium]|nr:M67 family metallopeptidase [Vicinamibacteria bacterium]
MRVPGPLLATILNHARQGYPLEVCGVLLGRRTLNARTVEEVVPVPNREAENPEVRYQIAPEDVIRIQREARETGREILGYYHSHPDHPARPSETDRLLAAQGLSDGVLHLIVGVEAGRIAETTAWVFEEQGQGFVEEALE